MEATVQGRFKFLGKMRTPGERLSAEEMAMCPPMARDALVKQNMIVLDGSEGLKGKVGGENAVEVLLAKVEKQGEQIDHLSMNMARLLRAIGKDHPEIAGEAPGIAEPSVGTDAKGAKATSGRKGFRKVKGE